MKNSIGKFIRGVILACLLGTILYLGYTKFDFFKEPIEKENQTNTENDHDVVHSYSKAEFPITSDLLDVSSSHVFYFEEEDASFTFQVLLGSENITATIRGFHINKLQGTRSILIQYYSKSKEVGKCEGDYEMSNSGQMWACSLLKEHLSTSITDIDQYRVTIK